MLPTVCSTRDARARAWSTAARFPWLAALRRSDARQRSRSARRDDLIDTLLSQSTAAGGRTRRAARRNGGRHAAAAPRAAPAVLSRRSARRRADVRLRGQLRSRRFAASDRPGARHAARHPPRRRRRGAVPRDPSRAGLSRRVESHTRTARAAVVGPRPAPRSSGRCSTRAGRSRPRATATASRPPCGWTSSVGHRLVRAARPGRVRRRRASLPALLAALERGEAFVTLDDGTSGCCRRSGCAQHATDRAARVAERRPHPLQALAGRRCSTRCSRRSRRPSWDETFARARAELQAFDGIQPMDPPPTFTARCAGISARGSAGWRSCGDSGSAAASPTTWGSARPSWCWRCWRSRRELGRDGQRAALARRRAAIAGVQLAAGSGAVHARSCACSSTSAPGAPPCATAFGDHDLVLTTYGTLRRDATALAGGRVRLRRARRGAGDQERRERLGQDRRGCSRAGIGWR